METISSIVEERKKDFKASTQALTIANLYLLSAREKYANSLRADHKKNLLIVKRMKKAPLSDESMVSSSLDDYETKAVTNS